MKPSRTPYPANYLRPALAILAQLPDGVAEQTWFGVPGVREAWGTTGEYFRSFHYCPTCGGWIEAEVEEVTEYSLRGLTGRSGTSYCCARCGTELAFNGALAR